MVTLLEQHIRTLMTSSQDAEIISLWLAKQPSPHTRGCYRHDSERLLDHTNKPLASITLADLQSFAQALAGGAGADLKSPDSGGCQEPVRLFLSN